MKTPTACEAEGLAAFRATRQAGPLPAEYAPSDEPATEEYSYNFAGMFWAIRCERGRYVYSWVHPCNEDAPSLAEAERQLYAMVESSR